MLEDPNRPGRPAVSSPREQVGNPRRAAFPEAHTRRAGHQEAGTHRAGHQEAGTHRAGHRAVGTLRAAHQVPRHRAEGGSCSRREPPQDWQAALLLPTGSSQEEGRRGPPGALHQPRPAMERTRMASWGPTRPHRRRHRLSPPRWLGRSPDRTCRWTPVGFHSASNSPWRFRPLSNGLSLPICLSAQGFRGPRSPG